MTEGAASTPGRRTRIAVVTCDAVGDRMAGPAIRAWNIAHALAADTRDDGTPRHDVRLVVRGAVDADAAAVTDPPFPVLPARTPDLDRHAAWADVVVLQGWALEMMPGLKADDDTVLVCDLYDPMHLEVLAQGRDLDDHARHASVAATVDALSAQLRRGDLLLCASERQRHLWLGHLSALGRLTPALYDRDNSVRSLLSVVPFGLPPHACERTGPGPRDAADGIAGIDAGDKLVLWAGGVYSWFDPLTLVRAIDTLREDHDDVRLLFLGMRHPNPEIAEAGMAGELRALAGDLGLTGKHVFFNERWVEYGSRQNWLLDADCGATTHFDHVETTFAFRTRVLDYLWAGLPVVTTDGDAFAELVRAEGLGLVVPAEDPEALAAALAQVLYDAEFADACRTRIALVRAQFAWPAVLAPLVEFCRDPRVSPDRVAEPPVAPRRTVGDKLRSDVRIAREYLADGGVTEVARRAAGRVRRVVGGRR